MRGTPPQSAELKLLKGNPGKRAINRLEPKYEEGVPPKPENLDRYGSQCWDTIIEGMKKARTLTILDGGLIQAACSSYSLWQRAEAFMLNKRRLCFLSGKKDSLKMRRSYPEIALARAARREYVSYCAELGITTITRSRVKMIQKPGKGGLANYFTGSQK